MKKIEINSDIQNKFYTYLACFYYFHKAIAWEDLLSIALFIYKYNNIGPKGCKDLSLQIYKLYFMIKDEALKCPSIYYKDGAPISLLEMDQFGHNPVYNKVAKQAKRARKCIPDLKLVDSFIINWASTLEKEVSFLLDNNKIDKKIVPCLTRKNEQLSIYKKTAAPEDILRKINAVYSLLKQNDKIIAEKNKITREKVNTINSYIGINKSSPKFDMDFDFSLIQEKLDNDELSSEDKEILNKCLFDLEVAKIMGDTDQYNESLLNIEDILDRTLKI